MSSAIVRSETHIDISKMPPVASPGDSQRQEDLPQIIDTDISARKSMYISEAKKNYAIVLARANQSADISKISASFCRVLRKVEVGLDLGHPTSGPHYSLLALKADIHLKITEKTDLLQYLTQNPTLITNYSFIHMPMDEIEEMIKSPLAELKASKSNNSWKKAKIKELAGILERIKEIKSRSFPSLPIVREAFEKKREIEWVFESVPASATQPNPQSYQSAEQVGGKVDERFWWLMLNKNELERSPELVALLPSIEAGLRDPNIQIRDKAVLILRKGQIQCELRMDCEEIITTIKEIKREIAITKAATVHGYIAPALDQLLDDIGRMQSSKRTREKEWVFEEVPLTGNVEGSLKRQRDEESGVSFRPFKKLRS